MEKDRGIKITNTETLKKEKEELLKALISADKLISKNIDEHKLDNPTYWNISKVLKKHGYDKNNITNLF